MPPIVDPDFENQPDLDTPPGQVPPLVTPFIQRADTRANPAWARLSDCGVPGKQCCILLPGFVAAGVCREGSICRTDLRYPVCVDPDVDSCDSNGGASVQSLCANRF